DDTDRLAVGHRRAEALAEAAVLLGHEHAHEPPQAATVEEPPGETGGRRVEGLAPLSHGGPLDRDLGPAVRHRAHLRGEPQLDAHQSGPECGNAAGNAASVGSMVAVGPACSATASSVLSACPVT